MLFSFENLHRRYLACRRNKRNTVNALRFEVRQEENLLDLRAALEDRTYHPGRSVCFVCKRPKLREIFAADFRDRVVHHVLVHELEKIWEPIFIHDSYACRRGKGVHAGVKRLRTFMGQVTANGSRPAWYLQLDIRNFFMSIDKQVLFDLLAAKIRDPEVLWLTRVLVFHDCTRDYVMKGDPALFERLPAHKTLFGRGPGKGLPIGNLNSQFFANVYLNGLDQFVKHDLKCRHYLRYCDDLVLLATDRAQLVEWRGRIEAYLRERLRLELNPNRARLRPVSDGVDFLGYIVRRDYQLVRRRVVGHLGERLRRFERQLVLDGPGYRRYRFDTGMVDELNAVLASYLGHFRLADSYRLREGLWRRFPFLGEYFDVDPASGRLDRKDRAPAGLRGVARQYRHFRRVFRGNVLFFQVGRFMEFYQPGDLPIAQVLGLAPMSANRRGARDGFPVSQAGRHLLRLLAAGRSVVLIGETGRLLDGVKERVPRYRFECAAQPCKIHGDYKRSSHMIKAGIVGGTGYTGVELLRLLAQHPEVEVSAITSRKEAGMPVADMFPSLRGRVGLAFSTPEDAPLKSCDVVFFATPNGVAMQQTRELLDAGVKVIDLAADFRIQDIGVWSKWYGMEHACPDLVAEAVYGLPEINREKIKTARLIANPGCYPTAVQLGFLPLIEAGAIDTGWLVADCKSGVSGAGRKAEVHTLFAEATDNFKAYAVPGHRHQPEIRQGLARMAGHDVNLTFVPHLTPLVRGIHATLYARLTKDIDLQNLYETRYANEYFVDVLPAKGHPETRSVRASNLCRMAVHRPQGGEAGNNVVVVLSVIDNLVKGASGQAVQNMNLLFGLQENLGLTQVPVSP